MRILSMSRSAYGLMIAFELVLVTACQGTPATTSEVTRVVRVTDIAVPAIMEVTRIVQAPPLEVTRLVQAPPREVTRLVPVTHTIQSPPLEVTRLVPVTRIVEVTRIVVVAVPTAAPASTSLSTPAAVPTPTLAPAPTLTLAPTAVSSIVNAAPLVWYDFEGDFWTAGLITDRSGNGHDAHVNGVVAATAGVFGRQAIFFTGNGFIQTQNNPASGRNNVTFSLWFMTDHPEANYKLASAAWWQGGPGSGWILATHIPEFWSEDMRSLYLPDLTNEDNHFPAGAWVHEAVTYDGSRIKEYTNGQLVNDWPTTGANIGSGQALAVGAWPQFSGYNFQGSMDEFQIFDRALTAREVQTLYNRRL